MNKAYSFFIFVYVSLTCFIGLSILGFSARISAQEAVENITVVSGQAFNASQVSAEPICMTDDANGLTIETDAPLFQQVNTFTLTSTGGASGSFTALPCAGANFSYMIVFVTFSDSVEPEPVPEPTPKPEPVAGCGINSVCVHGFINSLWDHNTGLTPNASNTPNWLFQLFYASGETFKASGQFGFLSQHAQMPPVNQLGYSLSPNPWQSGVSFGDVGYDHIFITPANFIQYEGSPEVRYSEFESILSYLSVNAPDAKVWIYEGLADMGGYEGRLTDYYDYNRTTYHAWFLDHIRDAKEKGYDLNIVPLASVFANLIEYTSLGSIPEADLFEDNAPHGLGSAHLVYAMIVYTYITGEKAPEITPAFGVNPILIENYSEIANFVFDTRVIF